MELRVRFKLRYRRTKGIDNAPNILARHMTGTLTGIAKRLIRSAQNRMRSASSEAKRSLQFEIKGRGLNKSLDVFSTLIQAFIDAYGLRPGTFPRFYTGSRLFVWAKRITTREEKGKNQRRRVRVYNFRRGRPRKKEAKHFEVRKTRKMKGQHVPRSHRERMRDRSARRFSFLAAREIYLHGIKPTYWNTKALEANKQAIFRDLQSGFLRAVQEINRG